MFDGGDDATRERDGARRTTRRALLALATGAATSLGGCLWAGDGGDSEPPETTGEPPMGYWSDGFSTETPTEAGPLDAFDRVVDAVDDVGCDPSGETPCDAAIERAVADGVAIRFPAGRYRFERGHLFRGMERIGFVGEGDVTFVPPRGFNDKLVGFIGDRVLFRGIDVDLRAQNTTAGLRFITGSGFLVEDVEFLGRGTHDGEAVVNALSLAVTDSAKRGTVRNVVARRGSAIGHYKGGNGRVGIWIGERHAGRITIADCRLEEFGNNGIYASRCFGFTEVVGGVYRNNNTSSVRLGGEGSTVRDATIEVDVGRYSGPFTLTETQYNTRAIVVEQGPYDKSGRVLIENCDVRMLNADYSQGAIVVWSTGNGPRIEGCRITTEVDRVAAVRALPPGEDVAPEDRAVRLRDTEITGGAANGSAVDISMRPWSRLEGTTIEQTGANRDGVLFISSNPLGLASTAVTATRYPVFVVNPLVTSDPCLVELDDETRLERTARGPGGTATVEFPTGENPHCIGEAVLSELDDPSGIAFTRAGDDTASWIHRTDLETAIDR